MRKPNNPLFPANYFEHYPLLDLESNCFFFPLMLINFPLNLLLDQIQIGIVKIQLAPSGIKTDIWPQGMTPNMRSRDLKKLEYSLESANKEQTKKYEQVMMLLEGYGQKLENTRTRNKIKIDELKNLISGLSFQQYSLIQKLQLHVGESSATMDTQGAQNDDLCCVVVVTQINYPNLNKQDSRKQVRGQSHEEGLVQIFMLDDMQLGRVLRLSRLYQNKTIKLILRD